MAPPENQQQFPNPAPPSLSAGDHELRDYYAAQDAPRPSPHHEPYLTPYLGLRARLSQTWINRWTILLLLVLIRTIFAIASVDDNLAMARKQALSACTSVENVGSAMASMPHYMSQGVNEMTAAGIEKAINGLMQMLILTLTGVEEIVVFVINMLTQTYVCLITLAISGGLHVAVKVAEDVGDFLNSTIKGVGDELGDVASDFQGAMNGFLSDINKLGSLFTGEETKPPTIDLAKEIDKLNDLQLPSGYDQGLRDLNKSIPTFEQVNNLTQTATRFPFETVRALLNESLPKYTMDRSLFPVPAKEQLTFCSDNDGVNDFFDGLVETEQMAKRVFYGVIITLAVLVMIPMAYREILRHRKMQERAHLIKNDTFHSMDAVYIVSRPYTSDFGFWLANKFSSHRRRVLVRWSVAYATTVPALFVLTLALAGLLACLCQYTLLKTLEKEVPKLETQISGFADKVIYQLNNASEQWAVGTNDIIVNTNTEINDDVLGWVNTTTGAINNTLNVFVDEMTGTLNDTFGDTVLYGPIMDVLNCLVLLKIKGIQKGLTWVSTHAKIDIPLLANDTFSLGSLSKVGDSQTDILATGPDGAAADAISDAVNFVIRSLASSISQEAIISSCVLLIWLIVVLVGIGRAAFLMCKGGNGGTYNGSNQWPPQGKFELNQIPTYEQATRDADPGDHSGNMYNGQPYTLSPAPLPTFDAPSASSHVNPDSFGSPNEKTGNVSGYNIAIRRPSHIRAPSHADYAVNSPESPPSQPNPFHSTIEVVHPQPSNPFADPGR